MYCNLKCNVNAMAVRNLEPNFLNSYEEKSEVHTDLCLILLLFEVDLEVRFDQSFSFTRHTKHLVNRG